MIQFQKPIQQKQSTINTDISRENYGSTDAAATAQNVVDNVVSDIAELQKVKIDMPETPPAAAGKVLRVLSVNEDGTFSCEWADTPSGGVTDVTVNGVSTVDGSVAAIPLSDSSRYGVAKFGSGLYVANGNVATNVAAASEISSRRGGRTIETSNLDIAVKAAMCDGKGAATERIATLLRMGCTVDDNGVVHWSTHEVAE